jgi:hypothetical protein
MSNQRSVNAVLLLAVISFVFAGCATCTSYETGARVTPAFSSAAGSRIYIHPPKDQTLSGWMETDIAAELSQLGFTVVGDANACDLIAYYSYSYDWDQPEYVRDFMIVFKPYPGDQPELLASASCYHRCSSSFLPREGREVHEAFAALRGKLQ